MQSPELRPSTGSFRKKITLAGVTALLLSSAGCGGDNTVLTFPPCKEDSQPKTADAIISSPVRFANPSFATMGNVQFVPGVRSGEFGFRFISTITPTINITPIENGMSFEQQETGRHIQVTGQKTHYPPETKLHIEATCDQ